MRRPILAVLVVCSLALLAAGSASANDAGVRQAIKSAQAQVKQSGELESALNELKEAPASLAKIHSAIAKFQSALRKVIAKVEPVKASTSAGRTGKADYIGGLQKLVAGFGDLDKAISDLKAHNKTGAKAEAKKAVALVKAGKSEMKKGEALLHV